MTPAMKAAEEALEQALDCIRGVTPEDMTYDEADRDTVDKIREALALIRAEAAAPDDDPKQHPALKGYLQQHRDEAYKGGWDDGYAEGYGKAKAEAATVPADKEAWFTRGYNEAYKKYGPASVPADREALAQKLEDYARLQHSYSSSTTPLDEYLCWQAAALIRLPVDDGKKKFEKLAVAYMRLRDLLTPPDAPMPYTQQECEAAISTFRLPAASDREALAQRLLHWRELVCRTLGETWGPGDIGQVSTAMSEAAAAIRLPAAEEVEAMAKKLFTAAELSWPPPSFHLLQTVEDAAALLRRLVPSAGEGASAKG